MAETLLDEQPALTAQVAGFNCPIARQSLTKDARRGELEQMRSEIGGGRRIVKIFDSDVNRGEGTFIPGSFVDAMINQIVKREFPANLD